MSKEERKLRLQLAESIAATKGFEKCRNVACQDELAKQHKKQATSAAPSAALYRQLEMGKITERDYKKAMQRLNSELRGSIEYIETARCDLKHCEPQTKRFLKTVVQDAKDNCRSVGCSTAKKHQIKLVQSSLSRRKKTTMAEYKSAMLLL